MTARSTARGAVCPGRRATRALGTTEHSPAPSLGGFGEDLDGAGAELPGLAHRGGNPADREGRQGAVRFLLGDQQHPGRVGRPKRRAFEEAANGRTTAEQACGSRVRTGDAVTRHRSGRPAAVALARVAGLGSRPDRCPHTPRPRIRWERCCCWCCARAWPVAHRSADSGEARTSGDVRGSGGRHRVLPRARADAGRGVRDGYRSDECRDAETSAGLRPACHTADRVTGAHSRAAGDRRGRGSYVATAKLTPPPAPGQEPKPGRQRLMS